MKYTFLIHLLLFSAIINAQALSTTILGVEEGLPASEIYTGFISDSGQVYMVAGNSVVKWDGITLEKWPIQPLEINNISNCFRENVSGLWLANTKSANDTCKGALYNGTEWFKMTIPTKVICFGGHTKKIFDQNWYNLQWTDTSGFSFTSHFKTRVDKSEIQGVTPVYYNDTILYFQKNYDDGISEYGYVTKETAQIFARFDHSNFLRILGPIDSMGIAFIGMDGHLYRHYKRRLRKSENKVIEPYKGTSQLSTPRSRYLVSFKSENYKTASVYDIKRNFEKVGIAKDIAQNAGRYSNIGEDIFFTSHSGLKRINPAILFISEHDEQMVSGVHSISEDSEGNIWFGGYRTGFTSFNGTELVNKTLFNSTYDAVLPGNLRSNDGSMYMLVASSTNTRLESILRYRNKQWAPIELKSAKRKGFKINGYHLKELKSGIIAMGTQGHGIALIKNIDKPNEGLNLVHKEKGLDLENVLTIEEDERNRLWCAHHTQGVAIYDPKLDTAVTWLNYDHPRGFGAYCLELDDKKNLWIGSSRGLCVLKSPEEFDPLNENPFSKVEYVDLPDGIIEGISSMIQHRDFLIIGNRKGLYFLDLPSYYKGAPIIYMLIYGEDIQGVGTDQNTMYTDSKGFLWVGHDNGASRIDIDRLYLDTIITSFKPNNVQVGGTPYPIKDNTILLPKDNRNFNLSFHPDYNPFLRNHIYYDIILTNSKGDTLIQDLKSREGSLPTQFLSYGKYKLDVVARKYGRVMDRQTYEIIAPKNLSESPWFWAGTSSILFLLFIYFQYSRNRQKKRILKRDLALAEAKRHEDQSRVQAIISSFNPHFINNSLHWIQSRYSRDQAMVDMVGRLSENIDYIFRKTREGISHHALEKELWLIQNYLGIQQERFGESYRFDLPSPEIIQEFKNTEVFLMQLQIHVENAIEHGLRNRPNSSFISIEFKKEKEHLHIKIKDDGCGRNVSKLNGSQGTQQGTAMLKNLREICNAYNEHKISQWYEDEIYFDELSREKFGTIAHILIPLNYQYELENL